MNCEICVCEVRGDIEVQDEKLPDGTWCVKMVSTPERNWICCDSCNALVCHNCCRSPQSGYCDGCIEEYNLYDYLKETDLITSSYKVKVEK